MASTMLTLALRLYNVRFETKTFEKDRACRTTSPNNRLSIRNDEKQVYTLVSDIPSSSDGASFDVNLGRTDKAKNAPNLTSHKTTYSEDQRDSDLSSVHANRAPNELKSTTIDQVSPAFEIAASNELKSKTSDQVSPASEKADASIRNDACDAKTPSAFGPNGSGYKGKDKSQKEYAATSGIYDYRGSYARPGRGRSRQAPEQDSDSDDLDDAPGGGGGGGPGRGGGPPNGEPGFEVKMKDLKGEEAYHGEWFWSCCNCGHGLMSTFLEFCPVCKAGHARCGNCPMESHRIRNSELFVKETVPRKPIAKTGQVKRWGLRVLPLLRSRW